MNENILYLAANRETEQHLDNEMEKLKENTGHPTQKWLSLLDPSENGRMDLYQSMKAEFACTCYFFGCVTVDDRPNLIAASLHY